MQTRNTGQQAQAIVDYRDKVQGGVLNSADQLQAAPGVDRAVVASLPDGFFVSDFGVRDVQIIGPQVGSQLRNQAGLATLYSLLGCWFTWVSGLSGFTAWPRW